MTDCRLPLGGKRLSIDRLGILITLFLGFALWPSPFVTVRANRIASGQPFTLFEALPWFGIAALLSAVLVAAVVALSVRQPWARLAAATLGLIILLPAVGLAATWLTPAGNSFARISPAVGFWLLALGLALLVADSMTRLHVSPAARVGALVSAALVIALIITSGAWNDLSVMKEYANRSDSFGREIYQHLLLAIGSLVSAITVGVPLGILCHRRAGLRAAALQTLGIVQTIPSIALFGILMVPLGYLAATVPLAHAVGIRGIGAAPAFVALFLYSLLPIVANTVVGLDQVSAAVIDAARGMGMSRRQRLLHVELPLSLPIILAGARIVLVQNLGLASVAALIGGGGLGTFIFQGIGQTAMDLVLLGAIPIVAMAFAAAVILDAMVDFADRGTA
ncbi:MULTISPECIES: ABC transporter permease [unclassified Chelatococcus]|uniref:ABC transporter permease n=1 Tax=unclassified Chelatococcus TaxID=2638111 RepID=UPI001BCC49FD|nr:MULTISPECIES: ABC transporter permease [unclassified Chelatococcus]MBS7700710.1 ABC transporter permease [Chelatococcus sp. YT9]MBX3559294.1 ABC transporter permease [Chelatococcus sp.]